MTELKTLKDMDFCDLEDRDNHLPDETGNHTLNDKIIKERLCQEAIKWIKELKQENLEYEGWERDEIKHKEFLDKFGIDIEYDDEYAWTNTMVNFLIKWIKHFFNIKDEELKK